MIKEIVEMKTRVVCIIITPTARAVSPIDSNCIVIEREKPQRADHAGAAQSK